VTRAYFSASLLKGHGDEADFLGLLDKSVPHESLTLPFGESGSRFSITNISANSKPKSERLEI
jgi:hypothetical protein